MKFSSSQLAYLMGNREARANLRALLKYVLTLVGLITLFAVVFHVINVELFSIAVPPSLTGRRLAESGIGSETGMSVVALDRGGTLVTRLTGDTPLERGAVLVMLGSLEQRRRFAELFEEST
jgi:K+/H+ antiporter YhaU regulatory subunit KhtT